jgi:diacylglycerol kinase (ATP)
MIGIVTNPNALGLVRDPGLAARLAAIVGAEGRVVETHTPEELAAAVVEFRSLGVDAVGICGGDGTNLSVLSAVLRHYPPADLPRFVVLRGGTVNTLARNVGVRGGAEDILGRLMAHVRGGTAVPSVETGLLAVGDRYGFLFGAGMPERFFEAYDGGPATGVAWASVLAARIIGSALVGGRFAHWIFDPVEIAITVDGRRLSQERFTLVVAGTIQDVGLGFRPTYLGGTVPGRFHLVATALSPARLARNAVRCLRGKPLAGQPTFDILAEHAELRFARPQSYALDGDRFRATEVSLRAGPRVTILTP